MWLRSAWRDIYSYISLVRSERVMANNQFHVGNYVILGMSILDTYLIIKLADNVYMKAMLYESYIKHV